MVVARCLLFVMCCLLFDVLVIVGGYLLVFVCFCSFVVGRLLLVGCFGCLSFPVDCWLCVDCCWLIAVRYVSFVVCCMLSGV